MVFKIIWSRIIYHGLKRYEGHGVNLHDIQEFVAKKHNLYYIAGCSQLLYFQNEIYGGMIVYVCLCVCVYVCVDSHTLALWVGILVYYKYKCLNY